MWRAARGREGEGHGSEAGGVQGFRGQYETSSSSPGAMSRSATHRPPAPAPAPAPALPAAELYSTLGHGAHAWLILAPTVNMPACGAPPSPPGVRRAYALKVQARCTRSSTSAPACNAPVSTLCAPARRAGRRSRARLPSRRGHAPQRVQGARASPARRSCARAPHAAPQDWQGRPPPREAAAHRLRRRHRV
jgi:hypothetical protein